MNARIGRLWRRRPAENSVAHDAVAVASVSGDEDPANSLTATPDPLTTSPRDIPDDGAGAADRLTEISLDPPEQPVLLAPVGVSRQIHVGDVLPPARRGWPGRLARLPDVPKRAILAAGVCAGLAAPAVARHLAMRLLSGPGGGRSGAQATLEITRIVFHGPLTAEAIATIQKALTAGRR